MLRRHHRFFQSIQILRDAALVAWAFYAAYLCRFSFPRILPYHTVSSQHETLAVGLMLVVIWPLVGWLGGLYVSRRSVSAITDVLSVLKTTCGAFVLLVTLTYFLRDVRYSRAVLMLWGAFCFVLLTAARLVFKLALRRVRARGYNLRHILVVGTGDLAGQVAEVVHDQADLGLRIAGMVALERDAHWVGRTVAGHRVLGTVTQLSDLLEQTRADQVMVALPIDSLAALRGLMDALSRETVDVRLVPDFYQYMTLCGSIEELAGLPIINLQATPLFGWNLLLKRVFDVIAASLGLLMISPAMLLLASAVRLSSRGPVFYGQDRVGMDGRTFKMLKFRTMRIDAEQAGARMAAKDDPRCTPLGAFLRRFSLDELPQLLNVLRGDMSLVGPRPERPCFIETFKQEIPRYALRHKIKAGMTGWAQVNGMRGNTSIAKRIELDLYYIENWSLVLDIKILIRTLLGGFLSPHAY